MRSPRKPGLVSYSPPVPAWVGSPSDDPIALIGGTQGVYGLTIADQHFDGIEGVAINLREYHDLTIERCTFADIGKAINLQVCNNVTIRDCAFYNIMGPRGASSAIGSFVQFNGCDTVTVEDCWGINAEGSNPEDIISLFGTSNGTVRRNRLFGGGATVTGVGINLGDGPQSEGAGGDNLLAEDNVLIDCAIAALGTNVTVRRNVMLGRGLNPSGDNAQGGIVTWVAYPGNTVGPVTLDANKVRWYHSDGSQVGIFQEGVVVTGELTCDVNALIDEFTRWTPTGYYAYP